MDSCLLFILLTIFSFAQLATDLLCDSALFLTRNLLLCGISLTSCAAFLSAYFQLAGLVGEHGLIPLSRTLTTLQLYLQDRDNDTDWFHSNSPMTFMLRLVYEKFSSTGRPDQQISTLLIDVIISLISLIYPHPILFAYMYISYYSIKRVGGRFFNFQWDALLLETLFLSVLLSMAYDTQTIAICMWAVKALLFRLMFGSGVVKLFSRDESWNVSYTAMAFHFLTQPLPTKLGMYAHNNLPKVWFRVLTQGSLVAEFVFPLLSLFNWSLLNCLTCVNYVMLQISIAATGYYGFFNYLTMVLSISLLDDAVLVRALRFMTGNATAARILEIISVHSFYATDYSKVRVMSVFQLLFRASCSCVLYPALILLLCSHVMSCYLLAERVGCVRNALSVEYGEEEEPLSDKGTSADADDSPLSTTTTSTTAQKNSLLTTLYRHLHDFLRTVLLPLHDVLLRSFFIGNHYGLFANMTKFRNEIIIEVSRDKVCWQMVEFLAKPGNIDHPPKSIWFFHMPRLDWVMWFLAFRPSKEDLPLWFWELLVSILSGEHPNVLQLLHPTLNPGVVTQGGEKHEYVRVSLVNYQFSGTVRQNNASHLGNNNSRSSTNATSNSAPSTSLSSSDSSPTNTSNSSDSTNATSLTSSAASTTTAATHVRVGAYWTTKHVATILPPTSLEELHAYIDAHDPILQRHTAQRRPPTAEDAKEIIMRTLFNKLQSKAKKKEQKID